MSASTQSASNSKADVREMTRRAVQNMTDMNLTYGDGTVHCFADSYTVPTTAIDDANDILRLIKMPPGSYIWGLRITITDCDTNATPTLVFSILLTDDSDVTKATLIASSTTGQAGGSAVLDTAELGEFSGSYWLVLKTGTAAATAAAGTLKVAIMYSLGVLKPSSGPNPLMTDAGV